MSNQNKNTKTSPKPGGAMFGVETPLFLEKKQKTLKTLLVNYCVIWENLKYY